MARVAWRNLPYWKKIGSHIGSMRRWRGLTDIQVSENLGIDLRRYRKIEKGQTKNLTLKEVIDMKRLFNVYLEEIIPQDLE